MALFEKFENQWKTMILLFYCGLFSNRCGHYRSTKISALSILFSMTMILIYNYYLSCNNRFFSSNSCSKHRFNVSILSSASANWEIAWFLENFKQRYFLRKLITFSSKLGIQIVYLYNFTWELCTEMSQIFLLFRQ